MNNSIDWKIVCLEIDEPSKEVGNVMARIWPDKVSTIKLPGRWDVVEKEHLKDLLWQFKNINGKILTVYGSGLFHHFTYGLLRNIADLRSNEYTYVHIDQHTDDADTFGTEFQDAFHCGNFVRDIKRKTLAKKVKYVGCEKVYSEIDKKDIVYGREIEQNGVKKSLSELLFDAPKQVYVSMDLDVLKPDQMKTGWPDGLMDLTTLLEIINHIKNNQTILSADILGFNGNGKYKNPGWCAASLAVYVIIAGTLFGEDTTVFRRKHAQLTQHF